MTRTSSALAAMMLAAALSAYAAPAGAETVSDLTSRTHIHGLAFDRSDPSRLFVATHHGLFLAAPDGSLEQISATTDDFMGFTPHPTDPAVFYASGHPAQGGNLGFIASEDGGRSWSQISPGADGPVDFHQLVIARSDPSVLYGVYGDVQKSTDGGASWVAVAEAPGGLIDLAVSASDPEVLYAATETGLLVSRDGAKSWEVLIPDAPVTTVDTAPNVVLAYVVGEGLRQASEPALDFAPATGKAPGGSFLLHLTTDPADASRMIAVVGRGLIVESRDGGRNWKVFGRR